MTAQPLLIAGTTSDAGKTTLVTGICRWLARQGVRVAPFKAQNMSNNSMVCADGSEIGRAQWIQAVAAGAAPEAAMNPVLLKPGSDLRSHVVVMGRPGGSLGADDFTDGRRALAAAAFAAYDDLASRYDVVVVEGAGSPAEINLRANDFVNMGLARHAEAPVVVVGDIDRGGVFAAMYGTLALLDAADQRLVAGFVANRFRGDLGLLEPGLAELRELTGRPTLGVLPWLPDLWLDSEDALAASDRAQSGSPGSGAPLTVAVVRFPRISNFTDVDALAVEPGVRVTFTADPEVVRAADLAVLPGSRATVDDLEWLRSQGLADAVTERARRSRPVLGICGGYQMLGQGIADPAGVERAGRHGGLGLMPVATEFSRDKTLERPTATAYAIHHGVVAVSDAVDPFPGGSRRDATWGTLWHGLFEDDDVRRWFLRDVAAAAGRPEWRLSPEVVPFAAQREARIDRLADAVEKHVDTGMLMALIEHGPPAGLPRVPRGFQRQG